MTELLVLLLAGIALYRITGCLARLLVLAVSGVLLVEVLAR